MNKFVCLCLLQGLLTTVHGLDANVEDVEYAPVVSTRFGAIRGVIRRVEGYGTNVVHLYQGIRYGDAERFAKSHRVKRWRDRVYNATHVRFACPQPDFAYEPNFKDWTEEATSSEKSSDDCLFLSIWQSATNLSHPHGRPVMVWLHDYRSGSIFSPLADARYLASIGNVIVVTVNYRVGPFGFMVAPDRSESVGHQGNLALYDIKLALEFVHININSFDGDPEAVTIFGDPVVVGSLLTAQHMSRLFHRAILSEGAPSNTRGRQDKSRAIAETMTLAKLLNCDQAGGVVDCLAHNKTVQDILRYYHDLDFEPNYPEFLLPNSTTMTLQTFEQSVDLMFGVNSNEGVLEAIKAIKNRDLATAKKSISKMFANDVDNTTELAQFYTQHLIDNSTLSEQRQAWANAYSDYHYVCPTIKFGQSVINRHMYLEISSTRHYAYRVMHSLNPALSGCGRPMDNVCHNFRSFYLLFGLPILYANKAFELNLPKQKITFTEDERRLSQELIHAWTRFAHSGVIGFMQSTPWERANQFDAEVRTAADVFAMQLDANNFTMQHSFARCDTLWKHLKQNK